MTGVPIAAVFLLCAVVFAAAAEERPSRDVELVDAHGERVVLREFRRTLRGDRFRGHRGSAEIEVAWSRIRSLRIRPGATPGGRMRIVLELRDGERVEAEFGEREGELRYSGVAPFGRAAVFFRDIRELRVLDDPRTGGARGRVDAATRDDVRATVRDRQEVVTELDRFRRLAGENVIRGRMGALAVSVPLAWIRSLELAPDPDSPMLAVRARLVGEREPLAFHLPIPEEGVLYGGRATFGPCRIALGSLRRIDVHEVQPGERRGPAGPRGQPDRPGTGPSPRDGTAAR